MLSGGMPLQSISLSDYTILLFCPLIHFSYNLKMTCFALLKSKLFRYLFNNISKGTHYYQIIDKSYLM